MKIELTDKSMAELIMEEIHKLQNGDKLAIEKFAEGALKIDIVKSEGVECHIKQEQRSKLDPSIYLLIKSLQADKENLDGNFNYAVTRLLKTLYSPPKYATYARAMGALSCIQAEFYRKVVADYENIKEEENGRISE